MELSKLQELLATPDKLVEAIKAEKPTYKDSNGVSRYAYEVGLNQYDPNLHDVKKPGIRPDREIMVPSTLKDQFGETLMVPKTIRVTRIAMPMQKHIIKQKASFAIGGRVELKPNAPSNVYDAVNGQWKKNKIHFKLKEIARRLMAETEVAVIFFSEPVTDRKNLRLRLKIISPSTGSILYPVFDSMDDMIAFGREYEVDKVKRFDLYTAKDIRHFETSGGRMVETKSTPLPYNEKMPVIFWQQERPECDDVQDLITSLEGTQSDYIDTNKRIGDPLLFLTGKAINMPQAGEPGKVLEGSEGSDAKFLSPANPTEARTMEFQMLDNRIRTLTSTVSLDPESLKGLGIESGTAMDRLLIAPHMAAKDMQDGEFGEGIQRMLNFLVHVYSDVLGVSDGLEIEPVFSLFRIDDANERVGLAMKANGGLPIMSQKSSIQQAGFSEDSESELQDILAQSDTTPPDTTSTDGNNVPLPIAK